MVERGLAFGDSPRQSLDVFYPERPLAGAPVLVFFYGGSWQNGDRGDYAFVGDGLAGMGFITVIVDYRLYPEVRFPAFVEDGALAVSWVGNNIAVAKDAGVVVMGHSAGAHIAALVALDRRYSEQAGYDPTLVRGLIGLAGPYAFEPLRYRRTRSVFEHLSNPELARPIHFACEHRLDVLLLHGADDDTVLPSHSAEMAAVMANCGSIVTHIEMPDVNHFDIVLGLSPRFGSLADVLTPIEAFLSAFPARS
ncbi:MAG: alpha/beta hydrolase [Pseudomonadota bacterium]